MRTLVPRPRRRRSRYRVSLRPHPTDRPPDTSPAGVCVEEDETPMETGVDGTKRRRGVRSCGRGSEGKGRPAGEGSGVSRPRRLRGPKVTTWRPGRGWTREPRTVRKGLSREVLVLLVCDVKDVIHTQAEAGGDVYLVVDAPFGLNNHSPCLPYRPCPVRTPLNLPSPDTRPQEHNFPTSQENPGAGTGLHHREPRTHGAGGQTETPTPRRQGPVRVGVSHSGTSGGPP